MRPPAGRGANIVNFKTTGTDVRYWMRFMKSSSKLAAVTLEINMLPEEHPSDGVGSAVVCTVIPFGDPGVALPRFSP